MRPAEELSAHLHDIATSAARRAGQLVAEDFRRGVPSEEKSSFHDLVTRCDRQAEAMIVEDILLRHPDSAITGEEGGARGNGAVRWYIDPIDGTNNFARGVPLFAVSIAAAVDGRIAAAAIYDPVRDELFSASIAGAFMNGAPIASRGRATDAMSMLLTDFPPPRAEPRAEEYDLLARMTTRFHAVRRLGCTTLMLAYVACGRADVVYGAKTNPWDVAAGMLIIEGAGGRFVALGRRGDDERGAFLFPAFIATCPEFDLERSVLAELVV